MNKQSLVPQPAVRKQLPSTASAGARRTETGTSVNVVASLTFQGQEQDAKALASSLQGLLTNDMLALALRAGGMSGASVETFTISPGVPITSSSGRSSPTSRFIFGPSHRHICFLVALFILQQRSAIFDIVEHTPFSCQPGAMKLPAHIRPCRSCRCGDCSLLFGCFCVFFSVMEKRDGLSFAECLRLSC